MKTLESLLSTDFDINDGAVMPSAVIKMVFPDIADNEYDIDIQGSTLTIKLTRSQVNIMSLDPIRQYNIKQINILCPSAERVNMWDAEELKNVSIECDCCLKMADLNYVDWDYVNIKAKYISIGADDVTCLSVHMKHTKIKSTTDWGELLMYAVDSLSIDVTCKFEKIRYLGILGSYRIISAQVNMLGGRDIPKVNPEDPKDISPFWDIDVWKTLRLNPKKWPDLGKICISKSSKICISKSSANSTSSPSLLLWKPSKAILPMTNRRPYPNVEYKDGWNGTVIDGYWDEFPTIF